jgi:hypothetical protein
MQLAEQKYWKRKQKGQSPIQSNDASGLANAAKRGHSTGMHHTYVPVNAQNDQYKYAGELAEIGKCQVELAHEGTKDPALKVHRTHEKWYESDVEKVADGQVKQVEVGDCQLFA